MFDNTAPDTAPRPLPDAKPNLRRNWSIEETIATVARQHEVAAAREDYTAICDLMVAAAGALGFLKAYPNSPVAAGIARELQTAMEAGAALRLHLSVRLEKA